LTKTEEKMNSITVPEIDFTKISQIGNGLLLELDRLRETMPVAWNKSAQAWIVTRHADVMRALSGDLPFSSQRYSSFALSAIPAEEHATRLPILSAGTPHWITNLDPPRHTRLRKLMTRAFGRKVIEDLRPFVQATVDRILDAAATDTEIEFVDVIARAITGRVILHLFGLPEVHLASFQKWSFGLNAALGSALPLAEHLDLAEESLREMQAILLPEIARRREHPTADFLSQLVQAREDDDRLTEEEVMGICYVSLIAGHDTTMNSISLGVDLLARSPEQVTYLLGHPENIVSSVVEISRLSAMSTAQPRILAEDFDWDGQKLRRGDMAFVMIAAANRDPAVFANPLKLDLSRETDKVVTFGPGLHHCIGHMLAKMQMSIFFPALFSRFDVAILDDEPRFNPSLAFRGLEYLHVRLTRRA
jgi:pimeloyl-[acyl-carrier protein] synthase